MVTWSDVIVAFLGMVAQGDVVAQVMTFTMFKDKLDSNFYSSCFMQSKSLETAVFVYMYTLDAA